MPFMDGVNYALLGFLILCAVDFFLALYICLRYLHRRFWRVADQPEVVPPLPHNPSTCPICFGFPQHPVETNCGHIFCGQCMKTLWDRNGTLGNIICPMCRNSVPLLFDITPGNQQRRQEPQRSQEDDESRMTHSQVADFVRLYNRLQNANHFAIWDRITLLPVLLRHLYNEMINGQLNINLSMRMFSSIVLSFSYFVLQTDVIPERLFGIFGLFDDLLFFFITIFYIANLYRHFVGRQDNHPDN